MVKLTELVLRDGHQSVLATRMRTDDMLPILEKMDQVGYWAVEMWGGATFDVPIRYLNEDPWERIHKIKEKMPNTKMMMLERAMNIVAYRNFPDDIVDKFVYYSKKNGIEVFRIFDALNDLRNMEVPIKAVKEHGGHAQGCISYTISPVHTVERYVDDLLTMQNKGCDSVCIKDMAGMISPQKAYDIVTGFKVSGGKIPIDLHAHATSGMTGMSYMRAAMANVDIMDTSMSPISGGTGHPPTESVVAALQGTEWDTGYDLELLVEIRKYWMEIWNKYRHLIRQEAMKVDPSVLVHQIPGGMLSNLVSQLEAQGASDKFYQVLDETARVREEMGYPPLVTPTSQVVGVQAVMNVLFGRYKKIPKETKDYCKGLYGKPPAPIKPQVMEMVLGPDWKDRVIEGRPADLLKPEWDMRKAELNERIGDTSLIKKEEDYMTYALYPEIALKFLKGEAVAEFTSDQLPLNKDHPYSRAMVKSFFTELPDVYLEIEPPEARKVGGPAQIPTEFNVEVDGEFFEVKVEPTGGFVVAGGGTPGVPSKADLKSLPGTQDTGMQGNVWKIKVKVGDKVKKGDVIAILEAMKMESEVTSDLDGEVKQIFIHEGDAVKTGDILMQIL